MTLLSFLKGAAEIEVNERNKTLILLPCLLPSWEFLKIKNIRSENSFFKKSYKIIWSIKLLGGY
jgi:hypothetical protein